MKHLMSTFVILCAVLVPASAHAVEKKPQSAKEAPAPIKTDKSGNVSMQASRDFATKQFSLFDSDKDGNFTMKEYRVPFDAVAKARKEKNSAADEKAIKDSFTRMDNDQDGKISKVEYLSDADLRFKAMDANKDGLVSPQEVAALQKKLIDAHKKATK